MDEIQKILIKAGRKDLAQKYYEKVAGLSPKLKAIKEKLEEALHIDWDDPDIDEAYISDQIDEQLDGPEYEELMKEFEALNPGEGELILKAMVDELNEQDDNELAWKIDKWMPDDIELQNEKEKIKTVPKMVEFLKANADEDALHQYGFKGDWDALAKEVLAK